jgi:Flp pilus assembly protein TadD
VALYVGGDLDRACAMFEAALQRNPNDAWVLASLANVRRMVGDPPEASLVMLAQAERLSPRDPRSWHWLGCEGWCHWKLGDYARMERAARRSLEMVSRYPWGWVQLAGSLALQDRRDEAAAALQTARDLLPRFTPARFFLLARMVYRHRFTGQTRADYRRFCDALQAVS